MLTPKELALTASEVKDIHSGNGQAGPAGALGAPPAGLPALGPDEGAPGESR